MSNATPSVTSAADHAMIAGTTGAAAIAAGAAILAQGGSAMDAALATAMAQIVLCSGSWVSFAGILNAMYYDAATGEVYNLNGAYNSVRGEPDPATIPQMPVDIMSSDIFPSGRATMVPGFMRAAEAGHKRFGKLPFSAVLAPAIKLAEEGFPYTASDVQAVAWRRNVLSRRPETLAIFTRPDGSFYEEGDIFCQPALAQTLRAVAANGVEHMYTGEWAQRLVAAVQSEGGFMTMDDLAAYRALWCDPVTTSYRDCVVYGPGLPANGGINTAEAMNLLEIADLRSKGHYSRTPEALLQMSHILRPGAMTFMQVSAPGADAERSTKAHAQELWNRMNAGARDDAMVAGNTHSPHSDAIAAVDSEGNMVGMLHSFNGVVWGMTGIFVDGVSVPDSGAVQGANVAATVPGERMPDPTNPTLVMRGGKPLIACAAIGMGLHAKTIQVLHSVIDFGMTPDEAAHAPALGGLEFGDTTGRMDGAQTIAGGTFDPAVIAAANALGANMVEVDHFQGGWAGVSIDPATGRRYGGQIPVWAVQPNNDGQSIGF